MLRVIVGWTMRIAIAIFGHPSMLQSEVQKVG
jgi:hypothetical protein